MLNTTLERLRCPRKKRSKTRCQGRLSLVSLETASSKLNPKSLDSVFEVKSGHLECLQCQLKFPILQGVLLLVDDVRHYLLTHVKGISKAVADSEIPREYLREFLEAKEEVQEEHIEEDLEAERVNALYLMNHYLRVNSAPTSLQGNAIHPFWWKPRTSQGSPLMDQLIREHWDHGPFSQIERWVSQLSQRPGHSQLEIVELGCGVGGLYRQLKPYLESYLGVDSSFASIALCRHLALGAPYRGTLRIPEDLLQGSVSRSIQIPIENWTGGTADFIVGDLENLPLQPGQWDVSLALNTMDMLDQPTQLPEIQSMLLKKGGTAIQSCPYIWHDAIARKLRKKLPREIQDSARAVEWIYEKAGLKIQEKIDHLPWLFFKHIRQLEIYSVHLFSAKKD